MENMKLQNDDNHLLCNELPEAISVSEILPMNNDEGDTCNVSELNHENNSNFRINIRCNKHSSNRT